MRTFLVALVLAIIPGAASAQNYGWNHNPEATREVVSKIKFKHFGETPAFQSSDPLPESVFLWQAYQKLFDGKLPPAKVQSAIGSCVGFGVNNAVCRTQAVSIAMLGAPFDYKDISEEVTYGGARQQICHQGNSGDGTNGSCAAKFVQKYGICPREKIGKYDLTSYSVKTCRDFGNNGCPEEILAAMKDNVVKDITLVTSWKQAKVCLANGWGIAICSGTGFASKRDKNGVKVARGNWSHCLCADGYTVIDGEEYGHIENSWGEDPFGPTGPGNPSKAGFWVAASTIQTMLDAGDSWAFSNIAGFPTQKIDWRVMAEPYGVRYESLYCGLLSTFRFPGVRRLS